MTPAIWRAAALVGLAAASAAPAAIKTWNNAGTDFNAAANWTGGVPAAGDTATFASAMAVDPQLTSSLSIGQLSFSTASASGYTLSALPGQSLTLSSGTVISAVNTSGTNTISANLVLSGGGSKSILQAGTGTIAISGIISEDTAGTAVRYERTSAPFPNFTITGLNTYTGNTTIADGAVSVSSFGSTSAAGAFGKGSIINFGSSASSRAASIKYTGAGETTDKILNLGSGSAARTIDTTGATGGLVFTSDVTVVSSTSSTIFTLSGNTAGNVFQGKIIDTAGGSPTTFNTTITKNGTGAWTLSGANTYTGATTVTAGTLFINGNSSGASGAVSVASGATLAGTGVIGGVTTLASGAKLGLADSIGHSLTFSSSAATALDISAAVGGANAQKLVFELGAVGSSDRIVLSSATGGLNIGSGVLNFADFSFVAMSGLQNGTYTLFDTSTSIIGTLSATGLSGAIGIGTGVLSVADNSRDIILTVTGIPEPASFGLAAAGSVLLLRRRRVSQPQ